MSRRTSRSERKGIRDIVFLYRILVRQHNVIQVRVHSIGYFFPTMGPCVFLELRVRGMSPVYNLQL